MGIAFGQCEACTPVEYTDLLKEIRTLGELSRTAWDDTSSDARALFIEEYLDERGYDHMVNRLAGLKRTHLNK